MTNELFCYATKFARQVKSMKGLTIEQSDEDLDI